MIVRLIVITILFSVVMLVGTSILGAWEHDENYKKCDLWAPSHSDSFIEEAGPKFNIHSYNALVAYCTDNPDITQWQSNRVRGWTIGGYYYSWDISEFKSKGINLKNSTVLHQQEQLFDSQQVNITATRLEHLGLPATIAIRIANTVGNTKVDPQRYNDTKTGELCAYSGVPNYLVDTTIVCDDHKSMTIEDFGNTKVIHFRQSMYNTAYQQINDLDLQGFKIKSLEHVAGTDWDGTATTVYTIVVQK